MIENLEPSAESNGVPYKGGNTPMRQWNARSSGVIHTEKSFKSKDYVTEAAVVERLARQTGASDLITLTSLLSVDPYRSRFVIIFPGFHMGLKRDGYEQAITENWLQVPKGTYHYRGQTSAMTAFGAVKGLVAMLGRVFDADEIQSRLIFATDEQTELLLQGGIYTHYIMLGTRSHEYSRQILHQYSRDFEFSFAEDAWSVIDKRENRIYTVPDPSKTVPGESIVGSDYALIEKIVDEVTHRVIFVIGGMWDTGTLAAGNFLIEHREEIYKRFGGSGFQYLLEITPGSTHVKRIIIERSPRPA